MVEMNERIHNTITQFCYKRLYNVQICKTKDDRVKCVRLRNYLVILTPFVKAE